MGACVGCAGAAFRAVQPGRGAAEEVGGFCSRGGRADGSEGGSEAGGRGPEGGGGEGRRGPQGEISARWDVMAAYGASLM